MHDVNFTGLYFGLKRLETDDVYIETNLYRLLWTINFGMTRDLTDCNTLVDRSYNCS